MSRSGEEKATNGAAQGGKEGIHPSEKPGKGNCGNEELDSCLTNSTQKRKAGEKTTCITVRKPLASSESVISVCWGSHIHIPRLKKEGAEKKGKPQRRPAG